MYVIMLRWLLLASMPKHQNAWLITYVKACEAFNLDGIDYCKSLYDEQNQMFQMETIE